MPSSSPSAPPPSAWRDPSLVVERLVRWSIDRPWLVIVLSLALTVAAAFVTVTRFSITTDTDQLLTADTAWRTDKQAMSRAFPQLAKVILVVVDGLSPDQADAAAASLAERLGRAPQTLLKRVWRPDGGPFFDRNGLLLLPIAEVRKATDEIAKQGPTLDALGADPSLRGLLRLLQLGAGGDDLAQQGALLGRMADVTEATLRGEPARLSWQGLMGGGLSELGSTRRFLLVDPVLDYDALEPAARVSDAIRQAAVDLGLTPQNGVTVRLTGAPPLADEEFATVREGAPLHLGLTVVAIAFILFLALRSGRVIFAVLLTALVGLVVTVGTGLLMVGRFNVISVAVAALFLGLGVDFGIQVAVRYRDERFKRDELKPALLAMARGMGWSLALAAASLLAGFFAFLPTDFQGVSELGLITGVGMIIAFLASLTLLPALLTVTNPPGEDDSVETPGLAVIDHWILANRRLVITASLILLVAGLPLLAKLDFDANPMHLRSDKTEAVATFLDISRQPGMTPYTISVLAPNLADAASLGRRLAALPEVDRVVTAETFVPTDQAAKRAVIAKVAEALDAFLDAPPAMAPPTDAELVETLAKTVPILRDKAGATPGEAGPAMRRLADGLDRLARATPERRAAAQTALAGDLPPLLARLKTLLRPETVTLQTLPASLREDWVAADGRARIEVAPKGDANDNAVLERFTDAVRTVAPNLAGGPVDVQESRRIIAHAFVLAGLLALGAICVILTIALRRPIDVALTMGPLVIATVMTLEAAYLIGLPLNLANIIALPLMLAVGVNFHIYYMILWREGVADMLAASLTRAIFFSALTTGVAFGSLWLSNHPGTASMGKLLTLSLVFTLLAAFVIVPAFLGPPRQHRPKG